MGNSFNSALTLSVVPLSETETKVYFVDDIAGLNDSALAQALV